MARITFPEVPPVGVRAQLAEQVVEERGGLLNLYRMLLHSPGVADGWLRLGTAIGSELQLDDRTRELVVCAVAGAVVADYEWRHHAPVARQLGVTEEQLAALVRGDRTVFDPRERAVLDLVEVLGRAPSAAGESVEMLRPWFEDREILELTVVVGFYWMVTRVTVGLAIERDCP